MSLGIFYPTLWPPCNSLYFPGNFPRVVSQSVNIIVGGLTECAVKEQGEVQSSIQESLALLVNCFKDVDVARLTQLEALVLQNIEQVVSLPLLSFLAVRFSRSVIFFVVA